MENGGKGRRGALRLLIPVVPLTVVGAAGWVLALFGDRAGSWVGIAGLCIVAVSLGVFLWLLADVGHPLETEAAAKRENSDIDAAASRFLDDLTGLPARFWFDQSLRSEIARSLRYHRPLSIVVIDVDDFKRINDKHGRASGDYVLLTVADILRKSVRQTDQLARLAADEFAIVVPETDESGAIHVGEKIRRAIELYPFDERLEVTVSVGVTAIIGSDTVGSCLERGEAAAMSARERGGNGVATSAA